MIAVNCQCTGDWDKFRKQLTKASNYNGKSVLQHYGEEGVRALAAATPKDSGITADSWYYQIKERNNGNVALEFCNDNRNDGVPIAIILQYGHVTGTGGYVKGVDYINPALEPIYESVIKKLSEEVIKVE